MMATVIRVKRCLEQKEPEEELILYTKKIKLDHEIKPDEIPTVFKFVTTLENLVRYNLTSTIIFTIATFKNENITNHIKQSIRTEFEENYKKHYMKLSNKCREGMLRHIKENRFKVISSFRSDLSESDGDDFTILDVEEKNDELNDSESKCVYDLYYTNTDFDCPKINELIK